MFPYAHFANRDRSSRPACAYLSEFRLPHRFFQRSASAANLSSMVCGFGAGAGGLECDAPPWAGFEPGVFIDNAMRLVFGSALSTCTFTIWPTLATSLGSLM